jgi:thiamine biosynthesis lipoprotein ApbE
MLRRMFLQKMAIAMGSISCAGTVLAQIPAVLKEKRRVSSRRTMMGTDVTIVSYHESVDFAQACHDDMFRHAEVLIAIFSRHDTHSALSSLNATKSIRSAPPELLTVLEQAAHYHTLSHGAFDIRVLPMLSLLEQEPSPDQLEKKLQDIALAQPHDIAVQHGGAWLAATTLHKISPWHHASVSVNAANAMAADAMATACMVLDTAPAKALLGMQSMRGIFIRHDGAIA